MGCAGDVIVGLDERVIKRPADVITALDNYKAGDLVSLRILRADADPKVPSSARSIPLFACSAACSSGSPVEETVHAEVC